MHALQNKALMWYSRPWLGRTTCMWCLETAQRRTRSVNWRVSELSHRQAGARLKYAPVFVLSACDASSVSCIVQLSLFPSAVCVLCTCILIFFLARIVPCECQHVCIHANKAKQAGTGTRVGACTCSGTKLVPKRTNAPRPLSHSMTHFLSLSLSLSHTHTHFHTKI
jgi:hypothetical protein